MKIEKESYKRMLFNISMILVFLGLLTVWVGVFNASLFIVGIGLFLMASGTACIWKDTMNIQKECEAKKNKAKEVEVQEDKV